MSYIAKVRKIIKGFGGVGPQKKFNSIVLAMGVVEPLFTLPQAYNIWIKHNTVGVSLLTWSIFTIAAVVWCIYGVNIKSKPLAFSYAMYTIFNGIVVVGLLAL
jgi:uncharacterized protein with PQ loop repeat